jgi:hypothetical protein
MLQHTEVEMNDTKQPGVQYIQIVKDKLSRLGTDLVTEDLDLLCNYIVVRFLKTSPLVVEVSSIDEVSKQLDVFVDNIYSFIVTFIHVVNSSPVVDSEVDA